MLAGHDNLAAHQLCQFSLQGADRTFEDHLVGLAEIVEVFKLAVGAVAKFGAATMTDGLVFAYLAVRVSKGFLFGKAVAAVTAGNLRPGVEVYVAELPAAFDKEVAGENVAVVLDYRVAVAGFMHGAVAGLLTGNGFSDVVKKTDAHLAAFGPPEFKSLDEELAIFFRGDSEGHALARSTEFGERDVLDVVDAQTLVELVEFLRLVDVRFAQNAEDVEIDFVALESLHAAHDPLEGAVALFVVTVFVVDFLRAVERKSDQPIVLMKELAPVVVEQDAIGLEGVGDTVAIATQPLLQADEFFIEGQTGKGGFAALKGKGRVGVGVEEIAIDQAFERFVGHAALRQIRVGVQIAVEVKAVGAIEIADGGGGFDQDRGNAGRGAGTLGMQGYARTGSLANNMKLLGIH